MEEETKEKISKKLKAYWETSPRRANKPMKPKKKKSVILKNKQGEIIKFESIKECAEYLNVSQQRVSDVVRGKRHTTKGCTIDYIGFELNREDKRFKKGDKSNTKEGQ